MSDSVDSTDTTYPFVDAALSRRLERTEGRAGARFVDARVRLRPDCGAAWTEVAGAFATFDGPDSFLTQTFGLGMSGPVREGEMEALEDFFTSRGAAVHHEVSPLADPALLGMLTARGYVPVELTTVLFRPTALPSTEPDGAVRVRRVEEEDADLWAETAAEGWASEGAESADFMREMGGMSAVAAGYHCFLAEIDGRPVAAGGLSLGEGVAVLAGASTVPSARRRGAQQALLHARLRFAAAHGCPLAMMGALPGSASQRNAERQGFRIAYTRIKWRVDRRG